MDINIPFYKMSKAQKTQLYMDNLTVIFNPQALFSDGTAFYRNPSEPDCFEEVHLRFRTGREIRVLNNFSWLPPYSLGMSE